MTPADTLLTAGYRRGVRIKSIDITPSEQAFPVLLTDGRALPGHFIARAVLSEPACGVTLQIRLEQDSKPQVELVEISQLQHRRTTRDGPRVTRGEPVSGTMIRALALEKLVRAAVVRASVKAEPAPDVTDVPGRVFRVPGEEDVWVVPPRRRRPTAAKGRHVPDEDLLAALAHYRAAKINGQAWIEHVSRTMLVSRSTAYRYVKTARERGLDSQGGGQ